MAFFEDLAPCSYFGKWESSLIAVGWLDEHHTYPHGIVSGDVFAALLRLSMNPWEPASAAGHQRCSLCRFTGGPSQVSFEGVTVPVGASNVFVPGPRGVFVAPTMILHYIDAHGYSPPSEFQDAVMACPPMRSVPYLKAVLARGLRG